MKHLKDCVPPPVSQLPRWLGRSPRTWGNGRPGSLVDGSGSGPPSCALGFTSATFMVQRSEDSLRKRRVPKGKTVWHGLQCLTLLGWFTPGGEQEVGLLRRDRTREGRDECDESGPRRGSFRLRVLPPEVRALGTRTASVASE